MIPNYTRPAALALGILALCSCSDNLNNPTGPEAVPADPAETPIEAAVAGAGTWVTRANMTSDRWGIATATLRNSSGQSILYAIGGSTASNQPPGNTHRALARVAAYNASTNTWASRAPLPVGLYEPNGAGVINGKIYVSGGRMTGDKNFSSSLYVYNPATNTWTKKHSMPEVSWGGITGVINGKLYVLTCEAAEDCSQVSKLVLYRYNPSTDQWTFLSVTPIVLGRPMGGVIGGKLYAVGGPNGALLVYDPVANSWTQKASLTGGGRLSGAGVAYHGQLYIIGGFDASGTTSHKTSVYDPATNTWSNKADVPGNHTDVSASLVTANGVSRIELVGGPRPGNNLQFTR
jgi:N-acetylneuraminic acid mutarotase